MSKKYFAPEDRFVSEYEYTRLMAEYDEHYREWEIDQRHEQEFRDLVGDDKVFCWLWYGDPYQEETGEQYNERMTAARDLCTSDEQFERLFYNDLYAEVDPVLIARNESELAEAYYRAMCGCGRDG